MLGDILVVSQYPTTFCGQLLLMSCLIACVASLLAAWFDVVTDYIKVSRYISFAFSISFACFMYSILLPGIDQVIIFTNLIQSSANSIIYPLQLQALIRASKGILPDASVVALVHLVGALVYMILAYSLVVLKRIEIGPNVYQTPLLVFTCLISLVNTMYALLFRPPSKASSYASMSNSISQT